MGDKFWALTQGLVEGSGQSRWMYGHEVSIGPTASGRKRVSYI